MEKRLIFPEGKQKQFLINSKKDLKLKWLKLAEKLNVNRRTLEKAYRYEWCSLPYNLFVGICRLRRIPIKPTMKSYNCKITYFNPLAIIGRKVLGETKIILPDKMNINFKSKPKKFDLSKIKLSIFDKEKKISLPTELTNELSEEIGISLGDGFLSDKKYEYRLKGNKNEKDYYDLFIKQLYKKLFNIEVNLKEYETTYGFELYSKAFWEFKNKILGIPAGRKDNIQLPEIIKVNDKDILISFIRGIFDTDGSVSFRKGYGFGNYYPTISISFKSKKLVLEVAEILDMLGFEPKVAKSKVYWVISLNGYKRLAKYSKIIGWSNPKSINKVLNWKRQYPELGKEVMVDVV